MLRLDTHELAWAAGFFDGEGCTGLRRQDSVREIVVQVPQSELTTLLRFQRAVLGLGKVFGPYRTNYPGAKPAYVLRFHGYAQAQTVLALLWKYMSQPKRDQAAAAMLECRDYHMQRALMGKGRAKLANHVVRALRERHAAALVGRQRVPRGFFKKESVELGVCQETLSQICAGRGYENV